MDTRMTLIAMALVVSFAGCNSIDSLPPLDAGRRAADAQAVDTAELVDAARADAYTPVAKVDAAVALPRGTRVLLDCLCADGTEVQVCTVVRGGCALLARDTACGVLCQAEGARRGLALACQLGCA